MSPSFPAVRITRRVFLAGIHVLLIIQPTAGQCQNREWMKYCYHNGLISSGSNIFPKKLEKPKKKISTDFDAINNNQNSLPKI
jgi:hypothetical protein